MKADDVSVVEEECFIVRQMMITVYSRAGDSGEDVMTDMYGF